MRDLSLFFCDNFFFLPVFFYPLPLPAAVDAAKGLLGKNKFPPPQGPSWWKLSLLNVGEIILKFNMNVFAKNCYKKKYIYICFGSNHIEFIESIFTLFSLKNHTCLFKESIWLGLAPSKSKGFTAINYLQVLKRSKLFMWCKKKSGTQDTLTLSTSRDSSTATQKRPFLKKKNSTVCCCIFKIPHTGDTESLDRWV